MMKNKMIIIMSGMFAFFSCMPSAKEAAEKSCRLYEQMVEADRSGDTLSFRRYTLQIDSIDNYYTQKYADSNPEWLLKYVELRNKCVLNTLVK